MRLIDADDSIYPCFLNLTLFASGFQKVRKEARNEQETEKETVQKDNRVKSTRRADLYQPGLPYSYKQALGRTGSFKETGNHQSSGMF